MIPPPGRRIVRRVSASESAASAASRPLSSCESGKPGPVQGLGLVVAGQQAEADRDAGVEGDPGEPGRGGVADVLEVRGAAPDDHAEGHHGIEPALAATWAASGSSKDPGTR